MSQKSPKTSQSTASDSSDSGSGYAVGYGKPPAHTRFKRGKSGNPKGRRKGQRNLHTIVTETLNQRISVREGDRIRSLSKLEVVILNTVAAAMKTNPKAQTALFTLMRSLGMLGEVAEDTASQPFTANDNAVIEDFLRRQQAESDGDNEEESPTQTTPPSKGTKS